jgi:hypothetical protein
VATPDATPSPRANPFPGLRPFEAADASCFFGRDEQCDALLDRLARRRFVGVVGASGSGKSSLVRAGLLPALQRGYLPAAGSSWQIAVFRPGASPLANLTRALCMATAREDAGDLGDLLSSSSLGLVAAARRLLSPDAGLLVIADQFEEIFRFQELAPDAAAAEEAVDCVNLLTSAGSQHDVPVYVVLTMRSDYLGESARFAGLPEALSDGQFLVPRMTREQLREAIEGPVAVAGGRIAPRLVQRLLHDVDVLAGRTTTLQPRGQQDHDQLPVLQHALMRVWEVSAKDKERGGELDLPHYERPPVETIAHALDRHADEVYSSLPTEAHRHVSRLILQRLTERDVEARERRRPTPIGELEAVAAVAIEPRTTQSAAGVVRDVLREFSAEGRTFLVINAQGHVDVSHESFIRNWGRLREWVQQEGESRRTYVALAETAARWEGDRGSLYRGPELAEARRWWHRERPSQAWAERYDARFEIARRFLKRSAQWHLLRRVMLVTGFVAAVAIAVVTTGLWQSAQVAERRARRAEAAAESDRDLAVRFQKQADLARADLERATTSFQQALQAQQQGKTALANSYVSEGNKYLQQSVERGKLEPAEAAELARLRGLETAGKASAEQSASRMRTLETQLAAADSHVSSLSAEVKELKGSNDVLAQELKGAKADLAKARTDFEGAQSALTNVRNENATLRKRIDDLEADAKVASGDPGGSSSGAGNVTPSGSGGDFRALYRAAVNARDRKNWREAAKLFESAASLHGDTGESISMPGFGAPREPYLPYYHLGVALQSLGDCSRALEAWRQSERGDAIRELPQYTELQKRRSACGERP